MHPTRHRALSLLIAIAIVMQHFEVFRFGGAPMTVGLLLGVPLILAGNRTKLAPAAVVVLGFLVAYVSLVGLVERDYTASIHFFGTLALVVVSAVTVLRSRDWVGGERGMAVRRGLWIALIVVVVYSVAQVIAGAAGSEALFNPFGGHQYEYQYNPHLLAHSIPRAAGFFLEPSYDAFVIGALAVALIAIGGAPIPAVVLALAGNAAAQSATGLLLFGLILAVLALKSRRGVATAAIAGLGIVGAAFSNYLFQRIHSITDLGTSGNYRIVAPLAILRDVLTEHPLGLPLGSIYSVVPKYGLSMVGVDQTRSIDNGYYVVVYYAGWLGLLLVLVAFALVLRRLAALRVGQLYDWIVPLWLFGSFAFSGGIVAPEFAFMSALVIGARGFRARELVDDRRAGEFGPSLGRGGYALGPARHQ
ncbi:putative colanic acid biosynthesis protein [mine drainage metagenome]|uniref:Putative colanic acid biosynthesis protein n=1 Tax=mine drainage metagenome TaxID=410659 RepID=A0A1J5RH64_9ZZZZ